MLNSRLVQGNLYLTLHDLGFGGFAVEGPLTFRAGSRHLFRFTTASGAAISLMAEAVYSREATADGGLDVRVTGFKYVLASADSERAVEALLDAALSPLSFD